MNLGTGAVTDKHRLTQPFHGQLRTGFNAAHIHADRGQRLNVCRWVHLVDQGPYGCTRRNDTCAACDVVEEISAGAFVVFCVGHEVFSDSGAREYRANMHQHRIKAASHRGYLSGRNRFVQRS